MLGWCALALAAGSHGGLVISSDGSDGELHVTADTTIDLSQAVDGTWDADNTAHAGQGIYDADQWAVVFKYSSVTIDPGATLTFTNHSSRAPVVWLVNGDVVIGGTVSLNGSNYVAPPGLSEPGPGGFRGGTAYYTAGVGASAGMGPGGGGASSESSGAGAGGSYGSKGDGNSGPTYGNPSLLPLIGGSGGAGDWNDQSPAGGAGGGAILIACSGTLTIDGAITANGGNGGTVSWYALSGGGSGGGIRLIAATLAGNGRIEALGGSGAKAGGLGRIRIERTVATGDAQVTPDPSVVPLEDGATPVIWPPADAPTVKIVSIGGQAVPDDPRASFGALGADTTISETDTTEIVVETTNVEEAAQVFVRVTPRSNATYTRVEASSHEVITADPLVIRWTADVPVKNGYSAVQVHVVRP